MPGLLKAPSFVMRGHLDRMRSDASPMAPDIAMERISHDHQRLDRPATTLRSPFGPRYDNFIGGTWVAPKAGRYFDNISP